MSYYRIGLITSETGIQLVFQCEGDGGKVNYPQEFRPLHRDCQHNMKPLDANAQRS